MAWHAALRLHYERSGERTRAHAEHEGPLRVLKALYPEGPGICHHVLVHPPSGLVGGDVVGLTMTLDANAHALATTAGATRFYRSLGPQALQSVRAQLAAGARLEWLPQENIIYSGAQAANLQRFELDAGAEMLGWEMLALGLPAADQPFVRGVVQQRIELPGLWLDAGRIAAADTRLLDSPLGLAGQRALATMWFAAGSPLALDRVEQALDAARQVIQQHGSAARAGVSLVHPQVLVLRALGPRIEPLAGLLSQVRSAWRTALWQLPGNPPRVWQT